MERDRHRDHLEEVRFGLGEDQRRAGQEEAGEAFIVWIIPDKGTRNGTRFVNRGGWAR